MNFSDELLFFFSAIGAFNGLLLSFYFLLFAKPRHISNYFLGGLLLTLSIRIGKSVIYHFNDDLDYIYLQFGITACIFVGPLLYCYVRSVVAPDGPISSTWKYHIAAWAIIISVIGFIFPFESDPEIWRWYIIDFVYKVWLAYIVATGFSLQDIFQKVWRKEGKLNGVEQWLLSLYIGIAVVWLAFDTSGYTSYILGALCFSFMLYLLILLLVLRRKNASISYKSMPKYVDRKIDPDEAFQIQERLDVLMRNENLHYDPNLKIQEVASKLNLNSHRLSQVLNDNLGKSFPQYVNELRIEAAKELIKNNQVYSLEAIGYECGFNSKSTFYATFKKLAGTTPAKYKAALA